ncbi:hypothetical protein BSNK01_06090 [Bacillaceae bacterium]
MIRTVPYDLCVLLPPFRGRDYVFRSNVFSHDNGIIRTNDRLQAKASPSATTEYWENVYVIGDGNGIREFKTGMAAERQGKIAADNIAAQIAGREERKIYRPRVAYIMETPRKTGLMVIRNPGPHAGSESPFEFSMPGRAPHLLKILFERYYLWKLR